MIEFPSERFECSDFPVETSVNLLLGNNGRGWNRKEGPQAERKGLVNSPNSQRWKFSCGCRILWTFHAIVHQTAPVYEDAVKMLCLSGHIR